MKELWLFCEAVGSLHVAQDVERLLLAKQQPAVGCGGLNHPEGSNPFPLRHLIPEDYPPDS